MNQEISRFKQAIYSNFSAIKDVHNQVQKMEDSICARNLSTDERFVYDIIRSLEDSLGQIVYQLEYLKKQVVAEGILQKNRYGRYELGNYDFTSGSPIEVLIYDEHYEVDRWVKTRVEHNGEDYYLYDRSISKVPMQGLKARVRR